MNLRVKRSIRILEPVGWTITYIRTIQKHEIDTDSVIRKTYLRKTQRERVIYPGTFYGIKKQY
jgi:3-isopropylmalate dehydratase small subunit